MNSNLWYRFLSPLQRILFSPVSLPSRFLVPIICAVLCAGGIVAFLWWQLTTSTVALKAQLPSASLVTSPEFSPLLPVQENSEDSSLLHLRQGDLLALQGEWGKAQSEYEIAVQENGGLIALRKLAQAELQRRDIKGAKVTLEQMKRSGARDEDILLFEGIILLRTGEMVRARELLENATESPQKHYGLTLLSIMEGNHEQVKQELTFVIQGWEPVLRSYARTLQAAYDEFALFPESPNIHLITLIARSLAQVQECELALPLLVQVTQEQDDYRDAWIVEGYCELSTERYEQSLHSFERAYALDPEKPEIQYFLGKSYAALGNHQTALTFLQYALKNGFVPETTIRQLIAQEALQTGNPVLTLEQYDALTKLPDAAIATFNDFITIALEMSQKEEAYLKATQALKQWPSDPEAFALLGWAALETGRTDEARSALEQALSLDPNLESAREKLDQLK